MWHPVASSGDYSPWFYWISDGTVAWIKRNPREKIKDNEHWGQQNSENVGKRNKSKDARVAYRERKKEQNPWWPSVAFGTFGYR